MKTVFICLLAIAAAALFIRIMGNRLSAFTRWKRTTKGIVNYDMIMQSFVYRTALLAGELIAKLRIPNIHDEMKYELSEDLRTITFMMDLGEVESCDLYIEPCENGCLFCVRRTKPYAMNNVKDLPYLMNLFWINKVQAEPIDYYEWQRSRRTGNA